MKLMPATLVSRPFADFEDKIGAIVIELDDLGVHLRRVVALAAVEIENALDLHLDAGAHQRLPLP